MMEKHGVDKSSEKDEMEKRAYITEAQRRRHEQFRKVSKGKYQKRMEEKYGKKEKDTE